MEETRGSVVVVDDDESQRAILSRWLTGAGHSVVAFADGEGCLRGLAATIPDAICLDVHLPGIDGLETLKRIRAHHPRLPVIMFTADEAVDTVVNAIRLGAFEYLPKPVDKQKLLTTVRNAVEQARMAIRLAQLEREVRGGDYRRILGRSAAMAALFRQLDRVAPTDVTVLIQGESGTGKELVAQAIHDTSARHGGPFVAINCAAIPESLQESELFGHERGAFTGATQRRPGRFEQAHGGTLFLDEIAELSPALQAKLLRAIQEQRFFRVGGSVEVQSDFRLIAATHRDLAAEARAGTFREDLYFRLAVLELRVPPLREREGDVALLAQTFATEFGKGIHGQPARLEPDALAAIANYAWPGNVRELQNAVQRAVVLASSGRITADLLPSRVSATQAEPTDLDRAAGVDRGAPGTPETRGTREDADWAGRLPDITLRELERAAVATALARHEHNLSAVARVLGISRTTLYRKMVSYGLARP